jgi:hypothetical protein
MFNKSIKSLVMQEINAMVDRAQDEYDAECEQIEREAETKKVIAKEKAVESIIGKFR